ncbi:MAG TPA: nucleoside-diphosphate sugar epimerase/dehydratase [Polyangiaceae bacterium]|nr:nucleoside-diphosphate sugar epimerase/dehydratase [Polyangiaceae bacterium]
MMQRFAHRSFLIVIDLAVLAIAYSLAFLIRFDGQIPLLMTKKLLFTLPYIVIFQFLVLLFSGVTRFAWRYISLREVIRFGLAFGVANGFLLFVRHGSIEIKPHFGYAEYAVIPMGVIFIDAFLAFTGAVGIRGLRRIVAERFSHPLLSKKDKQVRTLLLGAGAAGALVAREIANRTELGIKPVGFLDDDTTKTGLVIHGIPVLGTTAALGPIAKKQAVDQALITIASAPGEAIRRIVHVCDEANLPVRIIPGVFEILDGTVNLSRIREVSIEDLLGRAPIDLDAPLIESFVRGKRVLVTGAGGSIGSELCRQLARFHPASLTLVERAEFHLFTIHQDLIHAFPDLDIHPRICDVCDSRRLEAVFSQDRPHVVFHAAAYKHVPMMEWNPGEALKNNVFGTQKVADAADRHNCDAFVLISTDKAVNPTSIMGASKRVAEMYVQSLSQRSKTKYVAVRFGNVLGSAGSVIPIFQKQIEAGGPVTVTHPEMKRYFMTIPEACQLVMQASAMGDGGEIFVLDMGTPVKIADLARDLIRLSGFEPDVDIPIVYTGVRPGEKLFEELGFDAEKMNTTRHPKIFVGKLKGCALTQVTRNLEELAQFTSSTSAQQVRQALGNMIPEMQPDATERPPSVVPDRHSTPTPSLPLVAV